MRPVFPAVGHLVQFGDAYPVCVGRTVLRLDVHGDLAEVEVGADAGGGRDARFPEHFLDELACQLVRGELVGPEVGGGVNEDLVDRIDVDVLRGDVAQVDAVDVAADLHVMCHPGRGDDVVELQGRVTLQLRVDAAPGAEALSRRIPAPVGVDASDCLHDLEQPCAPRNAVGFEGRGDGQADGLLRAARIGYDQMRVECIQAPVHALYGGVEGLQVDGDIGTGFRGGLRLFQTKLMIPGGFRKIVFVYL